MIYTGLNNTGEVEAIYGHLNGVKSEVSEVYGSIGYNDPIFYSRKTLTGTSPLTFKGLGQPLKDYHIFGETVQNGTPSPDYPVDVQGVGEWDATEQQYKIPVTIGDTTTPIYIGSDPLYRIGDYADEIDFANQQIIRRVKKLVLNGTETNYWGAGPYAGGKYLLGSYSVSYDIVVGYGYCSHFALKYTDPDNLSFFNNVFSPYTSALFWFSDDNQNKSVSAWKMWIAGEYSNGTPLTVWYVLGTPETTFITIPTQATITGDNVLSVDTMVKPSAVSVTGNIKPTGYGRLLDVNDVDIQDSTGEPVFIQG